MDIFGKNNKMSWADMCDSDDESLGIKTPKVVEKSKVTEEFINKKNSINDSINFTYKNILIKKEEKTLGLETPKIVKNVTEEYIKKEKEYIKDNKNIIKPTKAKNKKIVKKNKKKGKCYTCFPQRKVLKHIIPQEINKNASFHHDMWNRNIIIVTPKNHYRTINDFPNEELIVFFKSINQFCKNWNLYDYSVSYNNGEWKNHDHFHCKIKILEKIANRMRADFFRMQKLKNEYK